MASALKNPRLPPLEKILSTPMLRPTWMAASIDSFAGSLVLFRFAYVSI